ncbi:MAG: transcription antitermination factor NusB [Deltaproteobacteria bacterium]|nr:transcription antitermination factor NusB [Deltaproteobacteria bacterium]
MGTRRKGRECAVQSLYQEEVRGGKSAPLPDAFWDEAEASPEARVFAERLGTGVREHLDELDRLIATHSAHWRIERMAAVDKSILRMAAYELVHCPDIPIKVTINEAVDIAKRFGTEESGSFINGILDSLAKAVRGEVHDE